VWVASPVTEFTIPVFGVGTTAVFPVTDASTSIVYVKSPDARRKSTPFVIVISIVAAPGTQVKLSPRTADTSKFS